MNHLCRSFLVLLPLALVSGVAAQAQPANARSEAPGLAVFSDRAVVNAGEGGYDIFRIPAAAATRNGAVVLLMEGRKRSSARAADDFSKVDLLSLHSRDGGLTWSKPQVVRTEGTVEEAITFGNPSPVYDSETGRLWCAYTRENQEVFVTYTDDDGETWAASREITAQVRPPRWTRYYTGPGHGLQLRHGSKRGRLIFPSFHVTIESDNGGFTYTTRERCHMVYSDDHGQSWKAGESTLLGPDYDRSRIEFDGGQWLPGKAEWHGSECTIEELEDGRLYLVARDDAHYGVAKGVAWSRDGGETWTLLKPEPQLFDPGCEASIIRWVDPAKPDSEVILFAGITRNQDASGAKGRLRLAILVSSDGCRAWKELRVVHAGPAAYCDLAVLPDGDVLCFYEGGERSAYDSIRVARFNRHWLYEKAAPRLGN